MYESTSTKLDTTRADLGATRLELSAAHRQLGSLDARASLLESASHPTSGSIISRRMQEDPKKTQDGCLAAEDVSVLAMDSAYSVTKVFSEFVRGKGCKQGDSHARTNLSVGVAELEASATSSGVTIRVLRVGDVGDVVLL